MGSENPVLFKNTISNMAQRPSARASQCAKQMKGLVFVTQQIFNNNMYKSMGFSKRYTKVCGS